MTETPEEPDRSPALRDEANDVEVASAEFVDDQDGERRHGTIRIRRSYSGPVPPPDVAAGWRDLVPDAPERMLRMAESGQQHRVQMDRRRQDRGDKALHIASRAERSESLDRRIVIAGLFSLATLMLVLGVWLITQGSLAGYFLIAPAVVMLGTSAVKTLRGNQNDA